MDFLSNKVSRAPKDRISELPDECLCHILSFIPTKEYVRTSCLSTRWKNVWASVPNLDLDESDFRIPDSFLMFVDRVLFFRNALSIQKFRLHCFHEDLAHINGWILTAIRRNPLEFDLFVEPHRRDQILELPKSLFWCKKLIVLRLQSNFIISTPRAWCLPSLKVLRLTVYNLETDPLENILPNCPVVEELSLDGTIRESVVLDIKVYALQLKTFDVYVDTEEEDHLAQHNEYKLLINSPKLENFKLRQNVLSKCVLENVNSLVKVAVNLEEHYPNDHPAFANTATSLMVQICNVEDMSLSAHCLEVCHLPTFKKLIKLKLVLHYCCSWWVDLLNRSPNVEYLELEYVDCDCDEEYGLDEHTELLWNLPEYVPGCLLSQLKTVCLKGFRGREDEMEVAEFLLENGEALKNMKIWKYVGSQHVCTMEELDEKILMLKSLNPCEVEVL